MDSETKLKKLQEVLKLVDESLTRKEFVEAFRAVVDVVKQLHRELAEQLLASKEQLVSSTKQDIEDLKADALEQINRALDIQLKGMDLIYDKLARLKNGKDGKRGERGERGVQGKEGKEGKPGKDGRDGSPDTAEEVRDKLESLEGGERLDSSAIKGLDERFKAIEYRPAAMVSDMRIRQAFKLILHTEEPVGDIDGVNTSYTVNHDIFAVLSFTLNGESIAQLPNYTIAGRTITFSTALPSDYAGRDFEAKYIG